jgi:hypothetical protein
MKNVRIRILDQKCSDPESGIKHAGSATLLWIHCMYCSLPVILFYCTVDIMHVLYTHCMYWSHVSLLYCIQTACTDLYL